ncbi:MAG: LacI family transcriptional regulator [Haloplasmataceae bacterium]|jgi:LacI family transcriptional regulator|nr:LacI family transcriptional regulator [Haloplasmataceae bacterium]
MITLNDLSKKTGFSVTTISKALNNYSDISDKTKKLILETAETMGYIPNASARSLVTNKSWTIGVVFEERTGVGITHPFFGDILDKFKKHIEVFGYDLLFISESYGANARSSYYEHCKQKNVDGIIILCSFVDVEPIKRLIECDIPSIIIDHQTDLSNCIYTNNYKSLYDGVVYLINKGHKKIAHVYGDILSFVGIERLNGYKQALIDNHLAVREDYLFSGYSYSIKEGYERGLEIINMTDRPTAIVAASDNLAIGLIKAFREHNINVPDDISIVGFDDNELSNLITPALTTIHQDKEKIALEAAKSLISQIENKDKKFDNIVIDGLLIERKTVKCIL